MPRYSIQSIVSKEYIKTINAPSFEQAFSIFTQLKAMDSKTFNKLYEVVER